MGEGQFVYWSMKYDVIKYEVINYDVIKYDIMKYDFMKYEVLTFDVLTNLRPKKVLWVQNIFTACCLLRFAFFLIVSF